MESRTDTERLEWWASRGAATRIGDRDSTLDIVGTHFATSVFLKPGCKPLELIRESIDLAMDSEPKTEA